MVVLRATQPVLRRLPPATAVGRDSDTALGDWYAKRLTVDKQPLLLLISSRSLLAILALARDVRSLPDRLPAMVTERLRQLGIPKGAIEAEIRAMEPVLVGPTRDRSVLGTLVDFGKTVPVFLPMNGWDNRDLRLLEDRLAETPCRVMEHHDKTIFPVIEAPKLLAKYWGNESVHGNGHPHVPGV